MAGTPAQTNSYLQPWALGLAGPYKMPSAYAPYSGMAIKPFPGIDRGMEYNELTLGPHSREALRARIASSGKRPPCR